MWLYIHIKEGYLKNIKAMGMKNVVSERNKLIKILEETKEKLELIDDYTWHQCPLCHDLCERIGTLKDDTELYQCPSCNKIIRDNHTRCSVDG